MRKSHFCLKYAVVATLVWPVCAAHSAPAVFTPAWYLEAGNPIPRSPLVPLDSERRTARSFDTPTLDRVVQISGTLPTRQRRRAVTWDLGNASVSLETVREHFSALVPRGMTYLPNRSSLWAFGTAAHWMAGDTVVSLGFTQALQRIAEPEILVGRRHLMLASRNLDLDWALNPRLHLSADWQQNSGSHGDSGPDRLVELAQGAPFHGQGYRIALSFLTDAEGVGPHTTFGVAAQTNKIAQSDAQLIGAIGRSDNRLGLFLRTAF